ncbi:hypothetical protein D9619_011892 [Psilocybe cf. subviscida]|uniref:SEC63 domain-containing protein n=1 Tax=Psilocybe cf. subviscida TaxID=2480587 RepID=A0A8H5B0F6_9AGAR|nr:hypothetical protein D9619_011892 [Psilocybe cf. subviscida]
MRACTAVFDFSITETRHVAIIAGDAGGDDVEADMVEEEQLPPAASSVASMTSATTTTLVKPAKPTKPATATTMKPGSTSTESKLSRLPPPPAPPGCVAVTAGSSSSTMAGAKRSALETLKAGLNDKPKASGASGVGGSRTTIEKETITQFVNPDGVVRKILMEGANNVQDSNLSDFLPFGFTIHHTGMPRKDRGVAEELFIDSSVQVLVCTQIYNPEKGRWVELSSQDVLQMLGRVGRPQFDTFGEGLIITNHSKLQYYLSLFNQQLPIESHWQFVSKLADNLNVEIVLETVRNRNEAVQWPGYTYLYVRILKSPAFSSVSADYQQDDEGLVQKRADIIHSAVLLEKCQLIEYKRSTARRLCSCRQMVFVQQSAGRILLAMFEICLKCGWAIPAKAALDLCKMVEKRMWGSIPPLWQFKGVPTKVVCKAEGKQFPWYRYFDLTPPEIGELISILLAAWLTAFVDCLPFRLQAQVQLITRSLLRIDLSIVPDFRWDTWLQRQTFLILVEDVDGEVILFRDNSVLRQRYAEDEHSVTITVPMPKPVFLSHSSVNKIQAQVFWALYTSDENVFNGAPTGSRKTVCAKFALMRLWSKEALRAVRIEPYPEIVELRVKERKAKFKEILSLTGPGESAADLRLLEKGDWHAISRRWHQRKSVQNLGLLIVDEAQLVGGEVGPTYEVVSSGNRYVERQTAEDLGKWMGASEHTIFNFALSARSLDMAIHIQTFTTNRFPSLSYPYLLNARMGASSLPQTAHSTSRADSTPAPPHTDPRATSEFHLRDKELHGRGTRRSSCDFGRDEGVPGRALSSLELDAAKLKSVIPAKQEHACLEVENAEDDLVRNTEVAITLIKIVLESVLSFPVRNKVPP